MAQTVGEVLLDVLASHGVTHIFGIPGDSIDLLMGPLKKDKRIEFVQVRHEEAGAFMASAFAKKTGKLGVCMGTAGPGAIHLLNGLYDAMLDHAPVLAITGQVGFPYIGTSFFQEIDVLGLFKNVAAFNYQVSEANQIAVMADLACRQALSKRAVSHLSFPFEVPRMKVSEELSRYTVVDHSFDSVPTPDLLDEAAKRIVASQKPVILAGKGALSARQELVALAEKCAIPVVNTLPGKGVIPDEHPLALGGLGLLGAKPAHTAMEHCDLLLMVGTNYPYIEFLPKKAQLIQIDWEASQIGRRYRVDLGLVGSARPTLQALLERIAPRTPSPFVEKVQAERKDWLKSLADKAQKGGRPGAVSPEWVADRLSRLVEPDANIAIDVGNSLVWMSRNFRIRNQGWLVSAWLGSMGFGLPAAIAAKFAEPARQSVAVVGDGGFAMLMADFVTAVKYQKPVTVVLFNNHRLGMIKFEQGVHGLPEFGTDLFNPNFAAYADAAGGKGFLVTDPKDVETALSEALKSDVPTIVDIHTDPDEKPLPPRITLEQATGYAEARVRELLNI
ncbi:thiamine pyrophosphate-dependent enzyme [Sulfobacillus harzensis]|uniref:Pyruvate oxidase n=1 Tax=Sulfobacillus harzensis TaxID=2729629 RepID=A0A7Y0L5T6_9FIRM|nr:thiamine pyrophosphate-dependent enzyme [Sulfobacillus harzensis]NMP23276.1 pyruvate oxidase [Sulfobacillus harzensis]